MGRKDKPRIIPEQDRRICGSICICQLTIVLSCVAIVYLSVAVYMPSYKAFQSGFEAEPVMCQTINTTMANNCPWASCGEWCLTKTSGFCPQIHATVRRNGTDVLFENCTRNMVAHCPQVNPQNLKRYNCNNGSECASLTGVFNCSLGHCANFSELFECHFRADGIIVDAERDNMKLNGFFNCRGSNCTQIKKPFSCDRYCSKITTSLMNIFVMHNNSITTMDCDRAYATTEASGPDEGLRLDTPVKIWDESMDHLLVHCIDIQKVSNTNTSFMGYDCLNGTLLDRSVIPVPYTNFTTFWKIYENSTAILDPTQKYVPKQSTLTIYNTTKLYINLEGCVNTLRGECKEFLFTHGQDGDNNTAQSRFQCYYNRHHSTFAVARFDLAKTWRELIIAVIVPTTLFFISLTALCIITQTVRVGDDAKMRCQYCTGTDSEIDSFGNVITSQPLSTPTASNVGAAIVVANNHSKGGGGGGRVDDGVFELTTTATIARDGGGGGQTNGEEEEEGGGEKELIVSAKCENNIQELQNLSRDNNGMVDSVLIPLSPCTEVSISQASQKDSEVDVAESSLCSGGGAEGGEEDKKEVAESSSVKVETESDEPLMIL